MISILIKDSLGHVLFSNDYESHNIPQMFFDVCKAVGIELVDVTMKLTPSKTWSGIIGNVK